MKNESSSDVELMERLRSGESIAFYEIVQAHQDALVNYLFKKWGSNYRHENFSAVDDAFMVLVNHPDRYDPSISALRTFLINIASRKMISAVEKLKGKKKSDGSKGKFSVLDVEVDSDRGNKTMESSPLSQLESKELLDLIYAKVEEKIPTEPDFSLAKMVLSKERASAEYAPLLGIAHLEETEQQTIVNKHKDRLKKRMQRNGIYDYIEKLKGL